MLVFCYMYIRMFYILYYHSHGWLHLEISVSTFSQLPPERLCVQYYDMALFPVWLQIQYVQILLFLDRFQILFEQFYFRFFKYTNLNEVVYHFQKQILIKWHESIWNMFHSFKVIKNSQCCNIMYELRFTNLNYFKLHF